MSCRLSSVQCLSIAAGTRFAYSNFGYIVLGRVIERISGLPYDVFMRQTLWTVGIHRLKLARTRQADADLSEVTAQSDTKKSRRHNFILIIQYQHMHCLSPNVKNRLKFRKCITNDRWNNGRTSTAAIIG